MKSCFFFCFHLPFKTTGNLVNIWVNVGFLITVCTNTERSQSGFIPTFMNNLKCCQRSDKPVKELTDYLFCWIWKHALCSVRAVEDFWNWSRKLQIETKKRRRSSNTDPKKQHVSMTDTQRVISALTPTWHIFLPIFGPLLDRRSLPRGFRGPASRSLCEIWESLWDKQRKHE